MPKRASSPADEAPVTPKKSRQASKNKKPELRVTLKTTDKKIKHPSARSPSVVSISDSSEPDAGAIDALDVDDSAYPEKPVPKTLKTSKARTPSTPPVRTRGAAKKAQKSAIDAEGSDDEARTSAGEMASEDGSDDGANGPRSDDEASDTQVGRSVSSRKPSYVTASRSSKLASSSKASPSKAAAEKAYKHRKDIDEEIDKRRRSQRASSSDEETFGASSKFVSAAKEDDVFGPPALAPAFSGSAGSATTVLRVKSLPPTCEVHKQHEEDSYIASKGGYVGMPALKSHSFAPFRDYSNASAGPGLIAFSKWGSIAPSMRVSTALSSVTFANDGVYINPSRVSPTHVVAKQSASSFSSYDLCVEIKGNPVMAVCVSPVAISESFLVQENGNLNAYSVAGIFHTGEFDRMVSLIGMVMSEPAVALRLYKDAVTFTNKVKESGSPSGNDDVLSRLANPSTSPSKAGRATSSLGPHLDAHQKVPVYDGRNVRLELNAGLFDNLAVKMKPYTQELTRGTFALVGYNCLMIRFNRERMKTYMLPRWVIVLADH